MAYRITHKELKFKQIAGQKWNENEIKRLKIDLLIYQFGSRDKVGQNESKIDKLGTQNESKVQQK